MRKFILSSLCALAIFSACEKIVFENPNNPRDVTAPTVTLTDPVNTATGIAFNHPISITFSEAMDPATITSSTITVTQGANLVAGTVTYSGTNAVFTQSIDLLPSTVYTVAITTGSKDLAGNALNSDYTISFTTGSAAETALPVINSTDPINVATGVVFNKPVDVTFSQAMDPLTINASTFTLKQGTTPVSGTITYTGTKATFTPLGNLAPNSIYTGTITTGVKNLAGFALISDYTFSFTTAAALDITAPIINATDPLNNATGIAINKTVGVTFSESMDPATINTSTFTLKQGTTAITGTVTYSGTQATFTPASDLEQGKIYTGTVTTGTKDLAGNALSTANTFSFSTVAAEIVLPVVTSTDPLNNATGVAFNKPVDVTFSQAMDPLTITASTFTLKLGTTAVAGAITYTGTKATFTPTGNLVPNSIYTVTITTGVKNTTGFALISNYTFSFTTAVAPDITAPIVNSTDPINNATGIALSKSVAVTFSESMNPTTINNSTFTLKQGTTAVSGTVTYSGTQATFISELNLDPSKTYTGTITTGAKDLAGNALSSNYIFSFTTGSAPDITPPTVILSDPINYATAVVLTKVVAVTFSEAMNSATINTSTFTLKLGTTTVSGTVTYSGAMAIFTPSSNLTPNSIYTGTITTGAKDVAGNSLSANYIFTFTSGAAPDITAPTVILADPLNNATAVVLTKVVAVTFSEAMNSSSINASTFTLKLGTTAVLGAVTYSGTSASFTPSSNLAPSSIYTGTITTGAMDVAGNTLGSSYTFSFTTGVAPDITAPTVSLVDPLNNATGVAFTKVIAVTFSEAMNSSSITNSTFTLKQGTTSVSGTVSYAASTASFTPSSNLTPSTTFTGTITTGAMDVAGNALGSTYTFIFTTAAAPDIIAPTVSSTDPLNNATGVATNKVIGITFSEAMNSTTITSTTFTLKQGTTVVTGTVAYSGTTAAFTPSVILTAGTVYTATITTGAKDIAGNALATNTVRTFTTAGTAPVVYSFVNDALPVIKSCNQGCHSHNWLPVATTPASTYYTTLLNGNYIIPSSYLTSTIYVRMNNGHIPTSYISAANIAKIKNWMIQGSLNN